MPGEMAAELLELVAKYGRQLASRLITPEEFAIALLDNLSGAPGDNISLAPDIVAAMPLAARDAVAALARGIQHEDFRAPAFKIAPGPMSVAEEDRQSALRTAGLKLWANALIRELVADEQGMRS